MRRIWVGIVALAFLLSAWTAWAEPLFGGEGARTRQADEKAVRNVLLIGDDTRKEGRRGRSDAVILASLRPQEGAIRLVSFMRDSLVNIPGMGQNRLNAAYAKGGPELLQETLEKRFGVTVDEYVTFTFETAADVIDALGGIDVTLTAGEAKDMFKKYPDQQYEAGAAHLMGKYAVYYLRIRKSCGGDFKRTQRQRETLAWIAANAPEISLSEFVQLTVEHWPQVNTSITVEEMPEWAALLYQMRGCSVTGMRVPLDDGYASVKYNGMSVLKLKQPKNRDAIQAFLQ